MAAPLDQVTHESLGGVFQEVLGHATLLREQIINGMLWVDARRLYATVAAQPLQAPETRSFGFFPEAIAAIHAYSESPSAAEGLYALVDVGAGTTAVSFFRLGSVSLQRRASFYASHTEIVGADDMDIALAAALRLKYPDAESGAFDSRSLVRSAKEASADGGIGVGDCLLTSSEAAAALKPVLSRIFEVYVKGFRAAYLKEPRSGLWETLTLIIVGGGSLVPGVSERLLQPPISFVEKRSIQRLALPKGIITPGGEALPVTLLAVGFGLSFVASDIPNYWRPAEVDPLPPRPTVRTRDAWGEDQV
ncbi:MAG: hypothetical protein EXR78_10000 [Deltaproteobacteria bacterium]|nr:hypothetical protein [Deltaproteobacteria bacterium]